MTMMILIDAGRSDSGNDGIVNQARAFATSLMFGSDTDDDDDVDAANDDDKYIERNECALESTHPGDGWTAL